MMAENFKFFEDKITKCLLPLDIQYFIDDLKNLFNNESLRTIDHSDRKDKVTVFLKEFKDIQNSQKYDRLKTFVETHNKWIYNFLTVDLTNETMITQINAKWIVLDNLLDLLRHSKDSVCVMNENIINKLYNEEVVSKANRDYLLQCLQYYGPETTLLECFNVVSVLNKDWYGSIVYVIAQEKTAFMDIVLEEMHASTSPTKSEYQEFANAIIDKHIQQYKLENTGDSNKGLTSQAYDDDAYSDYASYESSSFADDQELENDITMLEEENSDTEIEPVKLELKKFQLELAEIALEGKNVIIYAPTGTGKTVVAVHIANQHLLKNPNGKVAFLVPRTPLVTQQYNTFRKFKDPSIEVMEMRGKSDTVVGPLIANIEKYQVFVMTSDILRNALTVDDGNKLSSICQFSLIFLDECHNCMKLHPYTKIMKEYFKIKKQSANSKLPQIIGLTASPRSNKKDDIPGMQKSLFELCANMDCNNFSMVRENLAELEEEMTLPKQEVLKIKRRSHDEFETTLIQVMSKCEKKLLKMRDEGYFAKGSVKLIPDNKFVEEYVGFVGNLEKLNTVTTSENDGKQKAYCIYRYLNAYYRGLTVNQMFNEFYARETISKYLKHNGIDFTCCYDEEFYESYKNDILERFQSENPSIEKISFLIKNQLETKEDSRILIFVRQVDYTYYLADLLEKVDKINSEAIVGSNTKNNLKGCTINEMNAILKRFIKGETKVLIATTVVEEGLDVGLCNMVISYGHVTNETALIQRRGRARHTDSRYVLVLPPMLMWLEKKELLNERRKDMMMNLIGKIEQMNLDSNNMQIFMSDYQQKNFFIDKKTVAIVNDNKDSLNFKCKKCQLIVCSSEELRIVEKIHRVCLKPILLTTFTISKRDIKSFGSQGFYEIGGLVICKCASELGNFMLYKKVPFFQISISACNIESKGKIKNQAHSFKKWKDLSQIYTVPDISKEELLQYCEEVNQLEI